MTDKTGEPVTVAREDGRFTIAVDGKTVGLTAFADRDGQRVFYHTEVDDAFGGRGLASLVIAEALAATRAEGLRIVPVCPTVAAYVRKHHEFDDVVDRPTKAIIDSLG
ncbi:GNAT family N-acetyltransferase [Mycolicibacterium sp. 050158]|uniref:GNAT family N-acetyltransferase n=1 Tax=Mycolicibacterium sp. 050158 TaxID=3090602 RepID=UPI00299D42B1|nr:GNAT family N-acetyltransferase [Mycolicibacterium sp. 050158]MDX1888156.1 GNAT family N-acetyltransferase [Mycolicibacterium sp. 050158]